MLLEIDFDVFNNRLKPHTFYFILLEMSQENIYVVFDFDGTLVDTQKHHASIESDLLKTYDIEFTPEHITKTYAGRTPRERISEVFTNHGIAVDDDILEKFELQKNERIITLATDGVIGLLPGVKEFIQMLRDNNIPMGISSGTSTYALKILIEFYGIGIDYYSSADEVEHKKPAPDVFNKTFDKMGAQGDTKRIVIGDGISDVLGGKAAGAKTIYVGYSQELAKEQGADICVPSLAKVTLQGIYSL